MDIVQNGLILGTFSKSRQQALLIDLIRVWNRVTNDAKWLGPKEIRGMQYLPSDMEKAPGGWEAKIRSLFWTCKIWDCMKHPSRVWKIAPGLKVWEKDLS